MTRTVQTWSRDGSSLKWSAQLSRIVGCRFMALQNVHHWTLACEKMGIPLPIHTTHVENKQSGWQSAGGRRVDCWRACRMSR